MRTILLTIASLAIFSPILPAQTHYSGEEFRDYYDWFHQYSQTADQFIDGSTLYTFTEGAKVYRQASAKAQLVAQLPLAHPVTNIFIAVEDVQMATINGYTDQWLLIKGCDQAGRPFQGYIWGGHLAKGWRFYDVNQDEQPDMVLMGLSQQERQSPEDIQAELRLVSGGQLIQHIRIPKMCVFEECGSSTLLRVLESPYASSTLVFEMSVLTSGCLTGLDKAFVSWDGRNLECIYQAEYLSGEQYANRGLYLPISSTQTQVCYYSHEDAAYSPVWNCETIKTDRADNTAVSTDAALAFHTVGAK